uniref:RNA polymerase II elongation factor ELL N-terminal domain-containing protein n=1 Tax=Plectus sambesii TaxID=2011161 RepID=A0A914XHM8_9BILA
MAASLEMHRLRPPPSSKVSALMVKLTDECLAALKSARSAGHAMRLIVDGQGGTLEIGQGVAKFRFVAQQLPGPTSDAIQWDRANGYSTVASIATKIQIQATDKTFAETREKAQKLAEEEKKKATKDVNRRPRDQRVIVHRPVSHSHSHSASASGSRIARPSSSAVQPKPWNDSTSSKISPPKPPAPSTTTGQTARPTMSPALRAELMKKSLRQRVVHAVVLGKYSRDGVLERLRK